MNSVVVIVPVYKTCLSADEKVSFLQTLRMLGNHPICIVCPETLNFAINEIEVCEDFISVFVERFPNVFFEGISGYNRLLLSEEFYARFAEYDYMLICQLDAYVFRDELLEWCSKGYDYIGAPLFGYHFDIEHGKVGNGGFCLRRVKAYLDFFKGKKNVFKLDDIANRISLKAKPYTRWPLWILMALLSLLILIIVTYNMLSFNRAARELRYQKRFYFSFPILSLLLPIWNALSWFRHRITPRNEFRKKFV